MTRARSNLPHPIATYNGRLLGVDLKERCEIGGKVRCVERGERGVYEWVLMSGVQRQIVGCRPEKKGVE